MPRGTFKRTQRHRKKLKQLVEKIHDQQELLKAILIHSQADMKTLPFEMTIRPSNEEPKWRPQHPINSFTASDQECSENIPSHTSSYNNQPILKGSGHQ